MEFYRIYYSVCVQLPMSQSQRKFVFQQDFTDLTDHLRFPQHLSLTIFYRVSVSHNFLTAGSQSHTPSSLQDLSHTLLPHRRVSISHSFLPPGSQSHTPFSLQGYCMDDEEEEAQSQPSQSQPTQLHPSQSLPSFRTPVILAKPQRDGVSSYPGCPEEKGAMKFV